MVPSTDGIGVVIHSHQGVFPAATAIFAGEEHSARLLNLGIELAETSVGDGPLAPHVAAEHFRQRHGAARVVDAYVEAMIVSSADSWLPLPGRPVMSSKHSVVIVRDSGHAMLYDPELYRLRHREFPELSDALFAAAKDDVLAIIDRTSKADGQHVIAVDLAREVGNEVFRMTWTIIDGCPFFAARLPGRRCGSKIRVAA